MLLGHFHALLMKIRTHISMILKLSFIVKYTWGPR